MGDDEDLLKQAQAATANALTRGRCCDQDLQGLRLQIISLLSCDACQDIKFQLDGIQVTGAMFRAVSYALRDPGHTVHISYQAGAKLNQNGTKYDADYDWHANRMTFPFKEIGGKTQDQAYQCFTNIHECTHACLDLAQTPIWRFSNEVAGYFAATLFLKGQNLPFDTTMPFRRNLSDMADEARHANVQHRMYTMPANGLAVLKADVQRGYNMDDLLETGDGFPSR
jgi:hypothetical protein